MDDKILKHLEFIQNTINRMSTNSFIIKGWAITLVGIILGLNELEGKYIYEKSFYNFPLEMVIILLIIFLFWFINAYFLQQERRYIYIYSRTIKQFNQNSQGSNASLILDMNYKNYLPHSQDSPYSKYFFIASFLIVVICECLSYWFFNQFIINIISALMIILIALFIATYKIPNKYLCEYWTCFIGRTIITVYGTMLVLLLLVNHSMFNIESKVKVKKVECERVFETNKK